MIYLILKHAHSGIRWIVLLTLILTVALSLINYLQDKKMKPSLKKLALLTLITTHIQVLLGLVLFFISPKVVLSTQSFSNAILRFYLVEHAFLMILAVVLITVGYSVSKKLNDDHKKHRFIVIFYGIALLAILVAIPWPFLNLGGSLF